MFAKTCTVSTIVPTTGAIVIFDIFNNVHLFCFEINIFIIGLSFVIFFQTVLFELNKTTHKTTKLNRTEAFDTKKAGFQFIYWNLLLPLSVFTHKLRCWSIHCQTKLIPTEFFYLFIKPEKCLFRNSWGIKKYLYIGLIA